MVSTPLLRAEGKSEKFFKNLAGLVMTLVSIFGCVVAGVCLTSVATGGEFQLPPEVTPAMRSACESDVRRLCIGTNPTVAKVKICVAAKFFQLGKRCQVQIARAGLKP
jgi:hypothetical protein